VKWIDRVLEVALERVPVPLPEEEVIATAAATPAAGGAAGEETGKASGGLIKH
jgi:ATP-dependent Lon protease